jgi:hypothetical protein
VTSRVLITRESKYSDVGIAWVIAALARAFGAGAVWHGRASSTHSNEASAPTGVQKGETGILIPEILSEVHTLGAPVGGVNEGIYPLDAGVGVDVGVGVGVGSRGGEAMRSSLVHKTSVLASQFAMSSLCWWMIETKCDTNVSVALPVYSYSLSLMATVASLKLRLSLSDSYYYFMYL